MSPNPHFSHSVYFWIADGAKASVLAESCRRLLPAIPGIVRFTVGVPAGTPRAAVDNSYGVALLIEFVDVQAHDIYQTHPDHQRFVDECRPLWSRVQIYDVLTESGP